MPTYPKIEEDLLSDAVNDFVVKVPSWIVRWGITIIVLILILLIGLLMFVESPDVVYTRVRFVPDNKPSKVAAKIDTLDYQFRGEISVLQDEIVNIKEGQTVLVKMNGYASLKYGALRGKISYISDIQDDDSLFIAQVRFEEKDFTELKRKVRIRAGMLAPAEIITDNATLFQRLVRNIAQMPAN